MGLRLLVGARFQVLFHSAPAVLFTFPSRYWSAIGHPECLALRGGPRSFRRPFAQTGVLRDARPPARRFAYGALTLCGRPFQGRSAAAPVGLLGPYNPGARAPRFGLVRVRSPLLTESMSLSFPPATKMFQFAGFPSRGAGCRAFARGGFPHSDTHGSRLASSSPWLFAGGRVLRRFGCQGIHRAPFLT